MSGEGSVSHFNLKATRIKGIVAEEWDWQPTTQATAGHAREAWKCDG